VLEVRFTLPGDANLDGTVNSADAVILAHNYLVAGKTAWDQGNFNYDTVIDANDAAMLQKNYDAVVSPATNSAVATTSASSNSTPAAVLAAANVQHSSSASPGDSADPQHSDRNGRKDRRHR
jgi:hypothetical protein